MHERGGNTLQHNYRILRRLTKTKPTNEILFGDVDPGMSHVTCPTWPKVHFGKPRKHVHITLPQLCCFIHTITYHF
jgi:hypothetical protein